MRGHIAKKGNRYYAVLYEGIDPGTGKPRHRWHSAGETRKGAEKVLADLVKRMHDGDYRSPDKITLADYMIERWLPSKRTRVKASTAAAYEANIRLHIAPYIGHIPLQKLQPEDLDELYVKLLTDGRRNGAGGSLSAKTVRNVHATIQSALSDATRKGTVIRNVADIADPPSIGSSGRKMSVWSAEQLREFLIDLQGHDMYTLFYLSANTGMRRGELLGLRWSNIDLESMRLRVNQQIVSVEYELIEDDLKTPTSRRTIDLDERTVAVMRRHRRQQAVDQLANGLRSNDGYVFARDDGSPIHPDFMSQTFERLIAQSPLPRVRLHDLRHSHATIMLKEGVPVKVVSERLGHASAAFTMTVYQHILPGMQAEAAAVFAEALFGE